MRENFGFSLIELLAAIAILSIISLLSLPSLSQLFEGKRLHRESAQLVDTLRSLVLSSLQGEEELRLLIFEDRYQSESVTNTGIIKHLLQNDVRIESAPQIIRFSSSGVTSPNTIILKEKQQSCAVTLSLRGRVRSSC